MSFVHHYEIAALANWVFCSAIGNYEIAALANWVFCSAIGMLCLDQLNSFRCRENKFDRARYALMLAGATASGLQPLLFRSWPAWADVFMSFAVLAGMVINAVRWHLKDTMEGLA